MDLTERSKLTLHRSASTKSERITVNSRMGKYRRRPLFGKTFLLMADRLLTSPFEYTQAFDKALKEVIKTLPNRPARETADDVVRALL